MCVGKEMKRLPVLLDGYDRESISTQQRRCSNKMVFEPWPLSMLSTSRAFLVKYSYEVDSSLCMS